MFRLRGHSKVRRGRFVSLALCRSTAWNRKYCYLNFCKISSCHRKKNHVARIQLFMTEGDTPRSRVSYIKNHMYLCVWLAYYMSDLIHLISVIHQWALWPWGDHDDFAQKHISYWMLLFLLLLYKTCCTVYMWLWSFLLMWCFQLKLRISLKLMHFP